MPASGDTKLLRIVDAVMDEAILHGGPNVVCRKGCTPCCYGPFEISQLDALRLLEGLEAIESGDPQLAALIRRRAQESLVRYPGEAAEDEPCPALDPDSGACHLYDARPMTCRTFGPPVRGVSGAVAVCELCFPLCTDDEIAAAAVDLDTEALEEPLLPEAERLTGVRGETSVARVLASATRLR